MALQRKDLRRGDNVAYGLRIAPHFSADGAEKSFQDSSHGANAMPLRQEAGQRHVVFRLVVGGV